MYVGMYHLYNSLKTFSNHDLYTGLIGQKYKSTFNQNKIDLQAPFFRVYSKVVRYGNAN